MIVLLSCCILITYHRYIRNIYFNKKKCAISTWQITWYIMLTYIQLLHSLLGIMIESLTSNGYSLKLRLSIALINSGSMKLKIIVFWHILMKWINFLIYCTHFTLLCNAGIWTIRTQNPREWSTSLPRKKCSSHNEYAVSLKMIP